MMYTEWLDAERGRSTALATHMGKSKAAITLWRTEGVPIPHIREVSAYSGNCVTVPELLDHALACSEKRRNGAAQQAAA